MVYGPHLSSNGKCSELFPCILLLLQLGSMAVAYIAQKHMATSHGHRGGQIILFSSAAGMNTSMF